MVAEEYVDPHGDYGYTESPLKVLFSYELKLAALDKRVALPYRIRKYCKPPWDCIWKDNGTQHERINCNIVYRTNVEKYVDFWQPMVQKSISTIKEGDEDVVPYLSFLVGVGCELASAFCEKYDEIYQCKVMRSGELKPKDYSVYSKLMNLEADILRFLHGEYMKVGTPEDDCFKENKRLILLDQISRIYRTNGMKFITSCYSDGGFKENLEFVRDFFREIYHRKKGDYEKNRMWDFHRVGITGPAYSDYYCGQPLFFFIERHGGSYSVALDMKLRPRP